MTPPDPGHASDGAACGMIAGLGRSGPSCPTAIPIVKGFNGVDADLPKEWPGGAGLGTKPSLEMSPVIRGQTFPLEGGSASPIVVPHARHPCPRVPGSSLLAPLGGCAAWPPASHAPVRSRSQNSPG